MVKKAKAKAKAKSNYDDPDEIEEQWLEEVEEDQDEVIDPQAVPASNLLRTTTILQANPTPPTNVPVVYQGTPPTQTGLTPAAAPAADVTPTGIIAFADPLNGAVAQSAVRIPTLPVTTPAAELAGKAEFSGLTSKVDAAHGRLSQRGVVAPAYSETPNASHPSYGS
jgi:hypothetical protein